jgi:hypothetical protein
MAITERWTSANRAQRVTETTSKQASAVIYTDLGTAIPILINPVALPEQHEPEKLFFQQMGMERQTIGLAEADSSYSCHAWVFTDSRCHLGPESVDLILRENGYRLVRQPRVGDLIVYRDGRDAIVHTGVVRVVGVTGIVLVESKWGGWGRYMHRPDNACYGTGYRYYRSDRPGHFLRKELASPATLTSHLDARER